MELSEIMNIATPSYTAFDGCFQGCQPDYLTDKSIMLRWESIRADNLRWHLLARQLDRSAPTGGASACWQNSVDSAIHTGLLCGRLMPDRPFPVAVIKLLDRSTVFRFVDARRLSLAVYVTGADFLLGSADPNDPIVLGKDGRPLALLAPLNGDTI